jgi:hypothetical protein
MSEIIKVETRGEMIESSVARELQEVQGQIIMAKKFPRDAVKAVEKIKTACGRAGLAEVAIYQYTRGGANVTGPSIRLAETIAQIWGNLSYGIRETERKEGESRFESYAWDLENNVRVSRSFTVSHKKYSKKGTRDLIDPRDIYEEVANNGARRLRGCILSVVPSYVVEDAKKEIEKTQKAHCDNSPENIKKMIAAFEEYEVTKEMLAKFIGRNVESIEPAQMLRLQRIFMSIRDGLGIVSDWFDVDIKANSGETVDATTENPKEDKKQNKKHLAKEQEEKHKNHEVEEFPE